MDGIEIERSERRHPSDRSRCCACSPSADGKGLRLKDLADAAGLPRPTTHRILAEPDGRGMVERDAGGKLYRLGLDLFVLAARAGNPMNLRELCRPALLRLTGSLGETIFLLVRSGFDAVVHRSHRRARCRSARSPAISAAASCSASAKARWRSSRI